MTSKHPHSISQQGLTNKSQNSNLTQQNIVTYMSSLSRKPQTTQKLNNLKNTKIYETNSTQLPAIQPATTHSRLTNRPLDINSTNTKVKNYKSFSAITPTTNTKEKVKLTQTRITAFTQSTFSNRFLKCPSLQHPSGRAPSQEPHSLEGIPCGSSSYPALRRRKPTTAGCHRPPSPPRVDLPDQLNKISIPYARASFSHDDPFSLASASGTKFDGPTDYHLRTTYATPPTYSSPHPLQLKPSAKGHAVEHNKPASLYPEFASLDDGAHGEEKMQRLELQSQAAQLQETPPTPAHMDQEPPGTLACVFPAPWYSHLVTQKINETALSTFMKDTLPRPAPLHDTNTLAPAHRAEFHTRADVHSQISLDGSHLLPESPHLPHGPSPTKLQPGSDRVATPGTLLSFSEYPSRGHTEGYCTPIYAPSTTTEPPPLQPSKLKPLTIKGIKPIALLEEMQSVTQVTTSQQSIINPKVIENTVGPTPVSKSTQQSITNFFSTKSTIKSTKFLSNQHPSRWVQQKLAWELKMPLMGPSIPQQYHELPTIENKNLPLQQVAGHDEDPQGLQRPSPLRIGAESGASSSQQTQKPPYLPTRLSPDNTISTSDQEILPLPQWPTSLHFPANTTPHESTQILAPILDTQEQTQSHSSSKIPGQQNNTTEKLNTTVKLNHNSDSVPVPCSPKLLRVVNTTTNTNIIRTSTEQYKLLDLKVGYDSNVSTLSLPIPTALPNNKDSQTASLLPGTPKSMASNRSRSRRGAKRFLLQYDTPSPTQTRLSYFHGASLQCDLHDAWGHTLTSIDSSSTFRVFLQNPNGIQPYWTNYSLLQDLYTCKKYGAAIISLPETNLNWTSTDSVGVLNGMFRRTWQHAVLASSRAVEPFLSSYQPGGTATIVCDNWTSRVIGKGEDPHGLGRWSYVVLRGKGTTKVVIITAYNVGQRSHLEGGERTAYKQQIRLLSQTIRANNLPIAPNPRRQFIMDLQAWIEHLIQTDHEIILSLDANEPYNPDAPGTVTSLQYQQDKLTISKTHDGKLSTLIASCGLKDPLACHHPERPFPASYFRGKNRIDYILITPRLLEAVERSGSLPLYSLFQGDHRPYYIDFNAAIAFADSAYEIARPKGRGLQLKDPRIVSKYREILHEQLTYHKIYEKLEFLMQHALDGTWSVELTEEYQRVDRLYTESMLHAERIAGRKYSTKFDWSPELLQAVQAFRFWKMKLKLHRGLQVSPTVLEKYHTEAVLPEADYAAAYSETELVQKIRAAYQQLRSKQKDHHTLRQTYLEELAEAIVLFHDPTLDTNNAEPIRQERTTIQLRQLQRREKQKRIYRKIGTTLAPNKSLGLTRVDIPDPTAKGPDLGSPEDPKTWKGPWISITKPEEIARIVCSINTKQYNQAMNTPFGAGPLATTIGRNADTVAAKALLEGTMPAEVISSLLPETVRILQTLATPTTQLPLTTDAVISEEDFVSTFRSANEATSSSPSGRHIGHYKAAIKDPELVSLHAKMMSIPFMVGFAPDRWTQVTDIMLEKDPGQPRCHRLRILALFESDFNHSKRILMARKLSHHIEDNDMVPNMQYGSRPGRNCQSAVLQKVLSHDIVRLTRQTAAYMENDAIGCYDRLMNNVLLLILVKIGLPRAVSTCMGQLWDQTIHHIKSIYGTSSITYSSTPNIPLFGPGQGSTCGPIFWLLCFCLIVDSFDPALSTALFTSACMEVVVQTLGTAFVDDSSLSVTSPYVRDHNNSLHYNHTRDNIATIQSLLTVAQHWERLLFSTGGAINMQKSFWYLIAWVWKKGIPKIATSTTAPGKMELTSGYSSTTTTVPRIEPSDSFRTLGVYISPSGSQLKQIKVLRQHSEQYYINVSTSTLTSDEVYLSYMLYLRSRLIYPLPCSSLTQKQCKHVQAPALAALTSKMHMNRHTSHHIIFGDYRYGGLGLPDLYTDQGYGQLKLLVGHLKLEDTTGDLILIAISHLQLHIGSRTPFFALSYPNYAKWIDHTWLSSIWKHTHQLAITVEVERHWTIQHARRNDMSLMDEFLKYNFSPQQLKHINNCRLFLQVILLSDIATADGQQILSTIRRGHKPIDRVSELHWPRQENPPELAWALWRIALEHLSTNYKLHKPLGDWLRAPHQRWKWYKDITSDDIYLQSENHTWLMHRPVSSPLPVTRQTRQTRIWYNRDTHIPGEPNLLNLVPTTVYGDSRFPTFFYQKPSPTGIPSTTPQLPQNAIWNLPSTDHAFVDTPEFYQRLIGEAPPFDYSTGFNIATGLELETLVTCSDGSFVPDKKLGSHGWIISTTDKATLAQGAGPTDGHPNSMSSYRAELGGLITILYIIYRICSHYDVDSGKAKYHCDNKGVIKNVFSTSTPTISQFLHTDYDLVVIAKRLLRLLPVTIVAEWVKGHYTGDNREHKHDLNDMADQLAGKFNKNPPRVLKQQSLPCSLPGYSIRLIHDGSTITTRLYSTMSVALHRRGFITYLQTKHGWSDYVFNLIQWDAHEKAFKNLPRHKKIAMAKLIHNLVNTNLQNQKFYGKSPLCPSCQTSEETWAHVFTCGSKGSIESRIIALQVLQKDLAAINTPEEVIAAITHGMEMWERSQTHPQLPVHALTAGSLCGPKVLLTAAFTDQFHSIGWQHILMGRLSRHWGTAVAMFKKEPNDATSNTKWTSQAIACFWKYLRSEWAYRNTVVHGSNDQEMAEKIKKAATDKITDFYNTFRTTPNFILSRHRYLFTSRTLDQRLKLDIDSLNCWIRSVEDAIQALQHHNNQQRLQSDRFFAPFFAAGRRPNTNPLDSSASDSDYSASTSQTDDLTMTTFTSSTTSSNTTETISLSSQATQTARSSSIDISSRSSDPPSIISWSIS
jgi:hypothetical protein